MKERIGSSSIGCGVVRVASSASGMSGMSGVGRAFDSDEKDCQRVVELPLLVKSRAICTHFFKSRGLRTRQELNSIRV